MYIHEKHWLPRIGSRTHATHGACAVSPSGDSKWVIRSVNELLIRFLRSFKRILGEFVSCGRSPAHFRYPVVLYIYDPNHRRGQLTATSANQPCVWAKSKQRSLRLDVYLSASFPNTPLLWSVNQARKLIVLLSATCSLIMSVLVQSTQGCVLDALSLIDQGYLRCIRWRGAQKSHARCCFKRQCYQVLKSYYTVTASASPHEGNTDMLQRNDKPTKVKDKPPSINAN